MTSASQESSSPGDSGSNCTCSSCHFSLEGTPLWGRVEIQTKKKKTDAPRRSQCRQPGPSGPVAIPLSKLWACSELLLLHCLPSGYLVDSLPIVYSEGVIHKNSRTTILLPPLPLLLALTPPSTLSSIKTTKLKALSRSWWCGQEGRRKLTTLGWRISPLPSVSSRMTSFPSVPGWLQPSWPQGSGPSLGPSLPPLLLWSYTVGHKLWEICSLLSLCVDILSFFDKQLPCSDCSKTHLWFWAKERKLTLLHF